MLEDKFECQSGKRIEVPNIIFSNQKRNTNRYDNNLQNKFYWYCNIYL